MARRRRRALRRWPTATRAADVTNEYRLTAYPSYRLAEEWIGFGYVGIVAKPEGHYTSYYLGKGAFYTPEQWLQLWAGLIGVYTDSTVASNTLELRPFVGAKFVDMTERLKWRYFNWTRYELRLIDTLDTELLEDDLADPQPVPARDPARLGRAGLDAEDLVRLPGGRAHLALRHGKIDPLRVRFALGYIVNPRLLVGVPVLRRSSPSPAGRAWPGPTTSGA